MTATDSKRGAHLHSPKGQMNQVLTRSKNLLEKIDRDSPEYQDFLRELKETIPDLGGVDPNEPVVYEEDAEAVEVLSQPERNHVDIDMVISSLEHEIAENKRLYIEADSEQKRNYRAMRLESLNHRLNICKAAKKVKPETRAFGCKEAGTLRVGTADTVFPVIRFKKHMFTTDDPLLIARLLDYIERDERPRIEIRRPGEVALVNSNNGLFGQWINANDAEDVIRTTGGTFRRPYR